MGLDSQESNGRDDANEGSFLLRQKPGKNELIKMVLELIKNMLNAIVLCVIMLIVVFAIIAVCLFSCLMGYWGG